MSGAWQGRAASYYASGLVPFAVQFTAFPKSSQPGDLRYGALPAEYQVQPAVACAGLAEHFWLSETIAFALPLPLFDFPERPHRRGQQANHHGQKQPCQVRSGETSQHHLE
jgi:hypothetical protein